MFIYADCAATTPMSKNSIEAMLPYLDNAYGNPSSMHSLGQKSKKALFNARENIAKALNCLPREIIFTSGGSEADNQAILSAAAIGKSQGKMHIISSSIEHPAVLKCLDRLKGQGFDITLLDMDGSGIVDPQRLEAAICDNTILVSIMYVNNEIGTIQPISEIGSICKRHGIIFHTDAVQAIGHISIDVSKDNIDMLSLSAHKFFGPKGIGLLYAKKDLQLTSLIEGGSQERAKRAGTENVPAIAAMSAALSDATSNIEANNKRLLALTDRLKNALLKIPGSFLNGSEKKRIPGNINIGFDGIEGEALLLLLDQRGICISTGSACAAGSNNPSHVLLAIGLSALQAKSSIRISLAHYTTMEEIDYMIAMINECVGILRHNN